MSASSPPVRARLFNPRLYGEPRSFILVRRVLFTLFGIHMVFATFSGYRAIVQVKSLELDAPAAPLRAGSSVHVHGVSWNRVWVTLRVLLVQGAAAETLGVQIINTSGIAAWNPVPQHGDLTVQ